MATRSVHRATRSPIDEQTDVVAGFLDRFDEPATQDRWRGWANAAAAASELRNARWRHDDAELALRRWETFQATHGNL